jgi:hypothetical protein
MNIKDVITIVRSILGDNIESRQTFSDAELASHVLHAVEVFSRYLPAEETLVLATTKAVEYPAGRIPPCRCGFTLRQGTITLLADKAPDGTDARVYLTLPHTIDEQGSTISAAYQNLLATGAAAFATFEEAFRTTNRTNSGGSDVSRRYLAWAKENLATYCGVLKTLAKPKNVTAGRLMPASGGGR